MTVHIDTAAVGSVLLADGWHMVARGSFRIDALQFVATDAEASDTAGPMASDRGVDGRGFQFETSDGDLLAGPLASVLAVRYAAPTRPVGSLYEQLAEKLHGEVTLVGGSETVQFNHGSRRFEVWLDESQEWAFCLAGHRDGGRDVAARTGVKEGEIGLLPSIILGEVKAGFGRVAVEAQGQACEPTGPGE